MTPRHRGFGWLPDEPDERDHLLELAEPAEALLDAVDLAHLLPAVLDQGDEHSCVAQAVATVLFAAHVRAEVEPPVELVSRQALWWLCRHERGSEAYNTGTSLRTAFRLLNELGFCRERHWPHDSDYRKRPSVSAQRQCIDQRSKGQGRVRYERIAATGPAKLEAVRLALAAGRLVVAGWDVSNDFARGDFDHLALVYPPPPGAVAGGHAMVVFGYSPNAWRIRNSWGRGWADRGRCWFSNDYMLAARDLWTVRAAPPFSDGAP